MPLEILVRDRWTHLADYVYAYATWTLNVEEGRTVQVGMGWSVGGEPRGEKLRVKKVRTFNTVGPGALSCRVVDGGGPCRVRLDEGDAGLIPILSESF